MNKLKEIFARREQQYNHVSNELFSQIPNVLNGIIHFLNLHNELTNGDLTWEDIQLWSGEQDNDEGMIVVIGVITYRPGAKFKTAAGKVIQLDKATVELFKRMIKIGVPVDLATYGTFEEVVEFLQETTDKENYVPSEPQQESKLNFNLDELTEDQRKSLQMFVESEDEFNLEIGSKN